MRRKGSHHPAKRSQILRFGVVQAFAFSFEILKYSEAGNHFSNIYLSPENARPVNQAAYLNLCR